MLLVEWSKGSAIKFGADPYAQPASNTRSIAWAVGNFLLENEHFDASKAMCIGHSLGAHVCGFVGKRLRESGFEGGWQRISALDPAYPYFDTESAAGRLDRRDAHFVDVIHTSRLGLERPIGHADFYVSGGVYQPGCAAKVSSARSRSRRHNALASFVQQFTLAIEELFACSHLRAPLIYAESILVDQHNTTCSFREFCPCGSQVDFNRGRCSSCAHNERRTIGYWADQDADGTTGSFYGDISDKSPFCVARP